jgi:hypothetical protein
MPSFLNGYGVIRDETWFTVQPWSYLDNDADFSCSSLSSQGLPTPGFPCTRSQVTPLC